MTEASWPEMSSELRDRLRIYETLLRKWQSKINLVGPSTLQDIWRRHFLDSLQIAGLAPTWRTWVDLGSGAGFPGLVIAIANRDPSRIVHLIEADKRKAAFLSDVSRETHARVQIHSDRIERILPALVEATPIDVVSARALAPLAALLDYSGAALDQGALGLFLKGKALAAELTAIPAKDSFEIEFVPSQTDPDAKIVIVRKRVASSDSVKGFRK